MIFTEDRNVCVMLDTHSHTQWRILREALHTHGFSRDHVYNGGVSRLEAFGVVFQLLARAAIDLLLKLGKLAGDMSRMTVYHRRITSTDLSWVIQDDHLEHEKHIQKFTKNE